MDVKYTEHDTFASTMPLLTRRVDLCVNSDVKDGAENLSANNAQFEITMEQPIRIPSRAVDLRVTVEQATVWNTVFNVSAALNNHHIFITDLPAGTIDVTIPDGTYSTSSLSVAINREYVVSGGTNGLISLQEDFPTQRVLAVIDGTLAGVGGAQIDWSAPRVNTFRDLVGFDIQLVPAVATTVLTNQLGDNEAAFNNIEYFKIHWDGGQGFRTNNAFRNTIAHIDIDVPPGSQIVYAPNNPARSEASRWAGSSRSHLTFWLTDQADIQVDTGETWSARLVLQWEEYVDEPNTELRGSFRKRQRVDAEEGKNVFCRNDR